ncbi:hypothetical protein ACW0US_07190 [Xanthomonas euvesicatoria]
MTKADTIRLLHAERCSVDEIAAAVGYSRKYIVLQLGVDAGSRRRPGPARGARPRRFAR